MPATIENTFACATAKEFIDALSPVDNYFGAEDTDAPWVFRGQSRDFPLIPSLFRQGKNNTVAERATELTGRAVATLADVRLAERDLLVSFFDIADKRGLVLPDDSQDLRKTLATFRSTRGDANIGGGYDQWVTSASALSLTALAQHYGIPTTLLDWTRRSWIAAFFAADSAFKDFCNGHQGDMVVWALYFPDLGKVDPIRAYTDTVWVVTAPSASNANLKSQQGIFTMLNPIKTDPYGITYPFFDQLVQEESQGTAGIKLQKFTLPNSESPELLSLLSRLDITYSAVYPGYASIINDLDLRRKIR